MSKVRIITSKVIDSETQYIEAAGIKGAMPANKGYCTGSSYLELDPANNAVKVYFFNEESSEWMPLGGDE